MRRTVLELAFDKALGPPSTDCPGCGRPSRGTNLAHVPSADYEFAKCPECSGDVTNSGIPVGVHDPDGVAHIKRYILPGCEPD